MSKAETRFGLKYRDIVVPKLKENFDVKNPMQIPRLEKVVVNIGLGAAVQNQKLVEAARDELSRITGQRAVIARARKSIAGFKLREGMPIGVFVTLRRDRMWEFVDRLVSVALPQVRDFRGISTKAFDPRGNYTLGLKEQYIFPEVDYDKIDRVNGMNISFVFKNGRRETTQALMNELGFPFRR